MELTPLVRSCRFFVGRVQRDLRPRVTPTRKSVALSWRSAETPQLLDSVPASQTCFLQEGSCGVELEATSHFANDGAQERALCRGQAAQGSPPETEEEAGPRAYGRFGRESISLAVPV